MPRTILTNNDNRCEKAIATGCTAIDQGQVSWKVQLGLLTWLAGSVVATVFVYTSSKLTHNDDQGGTPLPTDITVGAILAPLSCMISAISLFIIKTGPCSKELTDAEDLEDEAEYTSPDEESDNSLRRLMTVEQPQPTESLSQEIELNSLLSSNSAPVLSYGSAVQRSHHSTVFASVPNLPHAAEVDKTIDNNDAASMYQGIKSLTVINGRFVPKEPLSSNP